MRKKSRFSGSLAVYALMLLALLVPSSAWAGPVQQTPAPTPVDQEVRDQIKAQGSADFWVVMEAQADLSGAKAISDWTARGQYVVDRLQAVAKDTQAGVIATLEKAGVDYKSYWVVNAIWANGDGALVNDLSAMPGVARIAAARTYSLPEPLPVPEEDQINAVEWNIDRIKAPLVWSTFSDTGQGIVVANIDSGVQYDHPAVVGQYRGNLGGGTFDHNYNWYDPSNVCGSPSLVPCDNNGHGTHTMGTMVGDDGGANKIGVAPGARFIMAKGCETNSCSDTALLASAEWILAPTDLGGANPRTDLRPNVVNNSWGGGGGNFWYQGMVQAWVASGIFPAFSIGNAGPDCGTAGSPGDYTQSYAAGAFDINNAIAYFSSRGPAYGTGIAKPNIAAPGVSVRSSFPTDAYVSMDGTSMASPHVAGTVALMWSAAPALLGDIAQTRAILDQTAVDTEDLQCGGMAENNNVWGEGRLDAFAAVDLSPKGPVGVLEGTVTESGTGLPVADAAVQAVGSITRAATTDATGFYRFPILSTGSYEVTVSKFGYQTQTASGVVVAEGATTVQDFALAAALSYSVSGYVRDQYLQPVANATITILGTPIPPAISDTVGFYSFPSVPAGTYNVNAAAGRCNDPLTQHLVLSGNVTDFHFTLPLRVDAFGYSCQVQPPAYIEANTILSLSGDDSDVQISLPFAFPLYGTSYSSAWVCTNGYLNFLADNCSFSNSAIPSTGTPNGAIYPFWDDQYVDVGVSSVRTELLSNPNRFVIEWRNVRPYGDTSRRMDYEVVLYEGGQILTQYRNIASDGREMGNSATLGIENAIGTVAFQYSYNEAVIANSEFAVMYRLPPSAFVEGTVTDFNNGLPIVGATVKALQGSSTVRQITTDAAGFYRFQLPLGAYDVEASMTNYRAEMATLTLDTEDATYTQDFALKTPRGEVTPAVLEFLMPMGGSQTKTLTLSNTGSLDMTFEIIELGSLAHPTPGYDRVGLEMDYAGNLWIVDQDPKIVYLIDSGLPGFVDVPWLYETPGSGTVPVGASQEIQVTVDTTGMAVGSYEAYLHVLEDTPYPQLEIPVTLIVIDDAYTADLVVSLEGTPDPVAPGEILTYTVSVANAGPSTASAVQVEMSLPAAVTLVSVTPSQGSCAALPCNLGSLAAGGDATVTVVVEVDEDATGNLTATAEVSSAIPDPDLIDNSDTVVISVSKIEANFQLFLPLILKVGGD